MSSQEKTLTKKDNIIGWLFVSLLALYFGSLFLQPIIGSKQPGHFFESPEYSTRLYVMVFDDDKSVKNYIIPADVSRSIESGYTVNEIYWPNGGSTNFDSCNDLSLTQKTSCYTTADDNGDGKIYYIQLTDKQP